MGIRLLVLGGALVTWPLQGAEPKTSFYPEKVGTGHPFLVAVAAADGAALPRTLAIKQGEKSLLTISCPRRFPASHCAIGGVPVSFTEKTMEIAVAWREGETDHTRMVSIPVTQTTFSTTVLKVDPGLVHPSEENKKRMEEDRLAVTAAYAAPLNDIQWNSQLTMPAPGPVTSQYGGRRSFNGEIKSTHLGVDFRAKAGTPIIAPGPGKIVLAQNLFLAGNLVIIDHGAGVFSSYAHLSKLKVKVGQTVKQKQLLGLSGATGRVTGPHLHWAARVNGESVDPLELKALINSLWN